MSKNKTSAGGSVQDHQGNFLSSLYLFKLSWLGSGSPGPSFTSCFLLLHTQSQRAAEASSSSWPPMLRLTPDPRSRQGPDPFLGLIGTMDALAVQGRVEVGTMDRKVHLLWPSGSIAAGLHAGKKMGWERRELWKKLRDGWACRVADASGAPMPRREGRQWAVLPLKSKDMLLFYLPPWFPHWPFTLGNKWILLKTYLADDIMSHR